MALGSATWATSFWMACGFRASKGARRSGDDAVPKDLSAQSRGLFVDLKKRSVPSGLSRRKWGSYRPCCGP